MTDQTQNPALNPPRQGAPGTAGGTGPQIGGGQFQPGTQDATTFGQNFVSGPDNPILAMKNAIKNMGRNPNNPLDLFSKYLLNAAPGLASAFQIDNANAPAGSDATNKPGEAFSSFLQGHLGSGDVFSTLANTAKRLPDVVDWIRNSGTDSSAMAQTPYLQGLADTLTSQGGQGTLNLLLSLLGPTMQNSTRKGYAEGLQNSLDSSSMQYGNNPTGPDLWSYLLGQGQ